MYQRVNPYVDIPLIIWSLIWAGLALWHSARNGQKNWFIVFLVIHTAGILEIIYLFKFSKKPLKLKDLQFWKR